MATETDVAAMVSALLDAGVDVNAKDKVRCSIRICARAVAIRAHQGVVLPAHRSASDNHPRRCRRLECRHAAAQCRVEGPPVCRDAAAGPGSGQRGENGQGARLSSLFAASSCSSLTLAARQMAWRPLHYAALRNHAPVVAMLLENGADVHAKDDVRSASRPPLSTSRLLTYTLRWVLAGGPNGAAPGGERGPPGMRSPAAARRRHARRARPGAPHSARRMAAS